MKKETKENIIDTSLHILTMITALLTMILIIHYDQKLEEVYSLNNIESWDLFAYTISCLTWPTVCMCVTIFLFIIAYKNKIRISKK